MISMILEVYQLINNCKYCKSVEYLYADQVAEQCSKKVPYCKICTINLFVQQYINHFGKESLHVTLPAAAALHAIQKASVFSQTTNNGLAFTDSATRQRGKI